MHKIAIIGLGRFGTSLARELGMRGAEVIAIDQRADLVDAIKDSVDAAVVLSGTDEDALRSQGIDKVDVCVVAIGENFEAALLTTLIAKKLGVPHVICRAQSQYHVDIFRQIGADEVIQPEKQAGLQLARRLADPKIDDYIDLGEGFTLIELHAPHRFQGRTIREINLRAKYGVTLIAVKRAAAAGGRTVSVPVPDEAIGAEDVLVLVGSDDALARLPKE